MTDDELLAGLGDTLDLTIEPEGLSDIEEAWRIAEAIQAQPVSVRLTFAVLLLEPPVALLPGPQAARRIAEAAFRAARYERRTNDPGPPVGPAAA